MKYNEFQFKVGDLVKISAEDIHSPLVGKMGLVIKRGYGVGSTLLIPDPPRRTASRRAASIFYRVLFDGIWHAIEEIDLEMVEANNARS